MKQFVSFLEPFLRRQSNVPVFGLNVVHPVPGVDNHSARRKSQHGFDLRTHIVPGPFGSKFRHISNGRQSFNQNPKSGFRGPKFGLGLIVLNGDPRQLGGMGDKL